MSETGTVNEDSLALTGQAGCFELDGVHLWENLPLFMLQKRAWWPKPKSTYGSRCRPAVRPCVGAMARPSVNEVIPRLDPSNDVATINANLSSCR